MVSYLFVYMQGNTLPSCKISEILEIKWILHVKKVYLRNCLWNERTYRCDISEYWNHNLSVTVSELNIWCDSDVFKIEL